MLPYLVLTDKNKFMFHKKLLFLPVKSGFQLNINHKIFENKYFRWYIYPIMLNILTF